ncbi:hypothetical protein MTR_7g056787 [Medicago truncatula]|uniref:F-box domain-containing protein n=1 Tax=Medicago truncatula TaxID=3880 RepID=A0A072U0U5_MEDTR|nr:hypothetical protein MTR_7g056787 [Medicago truncatula]
MGRKHLGGAALGSPTPTPCAWDNSDYSLDAPPPGPYTQKRVKTVVCLFSKMDQRIKLSFLLLIPNHEYLSKVTAATPLATVILLEELIFEMLSFLPVKSLMPVKYVSKLWKTMISDPIFIKIYFNHSAQNCHLALFISCTTFSDFCAVPISLNGFLDKPLKWIL